MPIATARAYEMDRRQLLTMVGTYGIGATFLRPSQLTAQEVCKEIDAGSLVDIPQKGGAKLYYWIDGMYTNHPDIDGQIPADQRLPVRANLTVLMELGQRSANFVESVVLMGEQRETIGVRYFDASMKMISGCVPYVTFENIVLDPAKTYYIVYNTRSQNSSTLYESEIKNPVLSKLTADFVSARLQQDLKSFIANGKTNLNPVPGFVTYPFTYYTRNGLHSHNARGRVMQLASASADFAIDIDFMHGDVNQDHYMRYFIVMDPVGRVLGMHRRDFGDPNTTGALRVAKLSDSDRVKYQVPIGNPDYGVPDIRDCPHIQIYTEDAYDAIARSIIRLR